MTIGLAESVSIDLSFVYTRDCVEHIEMQLSLEVDEIHAHGGQGFRLRFSRIVHDCSVPGCA